MKMEIKTDTRKLLGLIGIIFLWLVGFTLIPKANRHGIYYLLYMAPAVTWLSAECISLMMGNRNHQEFRPAVIVNCHIAVLLWYLNSSSTIISSSFFTAGCIAAIIWRGSSISHKQ